MPYILRKNPAVIAGLEATEDIRAEAMTSLADSSAGLVFEPVEHRYFLGAREMRSVSSIVESFVPFDAEATAKKVANNPRHPLYGKTVEEIVATWKAAGRAAADDGTRLHAFGEACFLYMTGREDEIEEEYRDRISPDGLVAIDEKEMAVARWWNDTDWNRYVPVAKETRIVNVLLKYAGTFDLLLYDRLSCSFVVFDYKSNKDLYKWFGEWLKAPLTMIKGNDVGKYTVQQTLYTIQLRNCGLTITANNLIWLRDDGTYETVQLDMTFDRIIEYAVRQMPVT